MRAKATTVFGHERHIFDNEIRQNKCSIKLFLFEFYRK